MKRRKPTIGVFLLGLAIWPGTMMAHDMLKVVEPNGHEVIYSLSTRPTVTFDKKTVKLVSEHLEVSYELYDVHRVEFIDTRAGAGVEDIPEAASFFNVTGESIEIRGLEASAPVSIYDTAGRLVMSDSMDGQGKIEIPISAWPQGVYVVNADKTTFKFFKK